MAAVRDSDAVIENRMLELKAETARQDLVTARKAAAIGNPIVLLFAKLRGYFDACALAFHLLRRKDEFAKSYADRIDMVAKTEFAHLNQISTPSHRHLQAVSNFPGITSPPNP